VANTTRLALPYPVGTSAFTVAADLQALAEKLDVAAVYDQGTLANRPTSTAGTPGVRGRFYFATDAGPAGTLFLDTGTAWVPYAREDDWRLTPPSRLVKTGHAAGGWSDNYNNNAQNNPVMDRPVGAAGTRAAMQIGPVTPTRESLWDVSAHIGWGTPDNTWVATTWDLQLVDATGADKPDVDGVAWARANCSHHGAMPGLSWAPLRKLFRLAAGQTYYARMRYASNSGFNSRYETHSTQLRLEGLLRPIA
jgi:hypothetical protein